MHAGSARRDVDWTYVGSEEEDMAEEEEEE